MYAAALADSADSGSLVDNCTDNGKLGLCITDDSAHDITTMDANLYAHNSAVMKSDRLHEVLRFDSKFNDAHRVIACKQTWIKVLLAEFETTTSYESLTYSVNDLQTILLTEVVKAIIDFLKQLCEITPMILPHQKVEVVNLSPEHRSEAFLLISHDFLAINQPVAHNRRNQDVDDAFQLLVLLNTSILRDEIDFATKLVLVGIVDPQEDIDHHDATHPTEL